MPTHILITGALHPTAIEAFQQHKSFKVNYIPDCTSEQLFAALKDAQVLVTRSETKVDRQVIDAAPNLKIIARAAVGVANIDIDYATEKGILIVNSPGKNTNSAAELSFGLLLSMVRNLSQAHVHMKDGGWDRHQFKGCELRGKRLGIVGLGNVGHRIAKFAHGFDMQVFAYDPYIAPSRFQQYKCEAVGSIEELAACSDILSLHVPLNKETRGMVDLDIINRMPDGSFLLNAARGGVAVEEDLIKALDSGKLAKVGIDTWENEPNPMEALMAHKNTHCSPHIGAVTEEAQVAIGRTVFEQTVKAAENQVVDYPVNLPEVGVINHPVIQTYAVLAEKLGSITGQTLGFNPKEIEIHYRGEIAKFNQSLLKLGFLKGFANKIVDGYVSFVNAPAHIEKLGISLLESQDTSFQSYNSALKVWIRGEKNQEFSIGGTVFDERIQRLSLINEFYFEVEPVGHFIIVENKDTPGVIGDLGTYLGKAGINIDSFDLSRNKRGGKAMALIRVDSKPTSEHLKDLNAIENMLSVKVISL